MDDRRLRSQLQQLHDELRRVDTLDEEERCMLREVARDIRKALGREDGQVRPCDGLVERLREVVARLEASHAGAALLMRQIIDELAYMGI